MEMIGQGNTAQVYEYEPGKVCKLFVKNYPVMYVENEYNNAREMMRLGIPCPRVYELIQQDERYGIVYEKIDGITLGEFILQNEEKTYFALERLCNLQHQMFAKETTKPLYYKEFLHMLVRGDKELGREIDALADGRRLLHGDFHPGNVMMDNKGDIYIIDFMNVCHGPALYDIARSYYLMGENLLHRQWYLEIMDCKKTAIEPFLQVIDNCRRYEMEK